MSGGALPPTQEFDAIRLAHGLAGGDPATLGWLHGRARSAAAPRFSPWAWRWIEEDFLSELTLQLSVTVGRPGFVLRGSAAAYVDVCVANLCKSWFRKVARIRRSEPLDEHPGLAAERTPSAERIAAALELRQALLSLDAQSRKLVVDKYALGYSLEEIADRMGIEAKTVQSRLHSCREKLRRWWSVRQGRFSEPTGSTAVTRRGSEPS